MKFVREGELIKALNTLMETVRNKFYGVDEEIEELHGEIKDIRAQIKTLKSELDTERRLRQGRHLR
ncbi:MAG: hypothetical protein GOVbin4685_34 [Prokaryotic dsDNA virus sp.]|jgi:predicted  nucleic acid-binding Zn-ribbon protein|nr:MAG: hypothetical protein GOVbin4685_34 [Prokaryotic dsDNA virus sp.]|tara:strand:- start:2013 stop:2210 length:198 start_codon:yes stop_codon:yes gene_type:complete